LAGLQDSMPRAALLSIHARVEGTEPSTWEDSSLVQLWGPRSSAYVVAASDRAIFTLGRLPDAAPRRRRAEATAARLSSLLDGAKMAYGDVGRALGIHPNDLRYGATTGTILMRWDGARPPTVWTVSPPDVDSRKARLELARRYLHVFAPGTPGSFARWAGITPQEGVAAFEALGASLSAVRTPFGDAWILARDESTFRTAKEPAAPARLLPSGDAYVLLLEGPGRELLVANAERRRALWPARVWPGAVLVDGEVVGTWRRADAALTVQPWRRLSRAARAAVEAEVGSLPLPGSVGVRWEA